jgi:hypothetical protein
MIDAKGRLSLWYAVVNNGKLGEPGTITLMELMAR